MKLTIAVAMIILPLAGALGPARAEAPHEYEIAANDGYGLEDCLAASRECGQVVADAWCEAHGHVRALAFGLRSAVEDRPTPVSAADETYVVKCGE